MNYIKLVLTIVVVLVVFLTEKTYGTSNHEAKSLKSSLAPYEEIKGEYTYVRVFKDGIWWIYVYDGNILVDEFPED